MSLEDLVIARVDGDSQDWQDSALCAQTDPDAFFPDKGESNRAARRVCLACEVRVECLEYALTYGEPYGIWGGMSERERRRMMRHRDASTDAPAGHGVAA
jgi:WhiB family redox-sensing transcriptional regulator